LASAAGEVAVDAMSAAGEAIQDQIVEAGGPKLQVTIVRATGLVSRDAAGDNFFCVCAVHASEHRTGDECQTNEATTTEPVWEETHAMNWRIGESLEFTVYERGVANTREVGRAVMHSMDFFPSGWSGPVPIEGAPEAELDIQIEPAASVLMRQAQARQSTKDAASAALAAANAAARAYSTHAADAVSEYTGQYTRPTFVGTDHDRGSNEEEQSVATEKFTEKPTVRSHTVMGGSESVEERAVISLQTSQERGDNEERPLGREYYKHSTTFD
jgi:hypothetical protein